MSNVKQGREPCCSIVLDQFDDIRKNTYKKKTGSMYKKTFLSAGSQELLPVSDLKPEEEKDAKKDEERISTLERKKEKGGNVFKKT
jgi:hypothetical protein